MDIHKLYKTSNTIFLITLILILIYSLDYSFGFFLNIQFPDIYTFTFGARTEGWKEEIWMENGFVEILQELILFFTIFYLLVFFYKLKNKTHKIIKVFLILEIIGLSYFFFEEISWGQHLIYYKTPLFIENINHQKEFNLHNISNLFNELPKSLVFIWCGLSILFINTFKPKIKNIYYIVINPDNNLIKISIVLLIFTIPNLIVSNLDLINYQDLYLSNQGIKQPGDVNFPLGYNFKMLFTIILSFNFIRLSELHEFIFAYYFLWHSVFLKEKIFNK